MKKRLNLIVIVLLLIVVMNSCASMATFMGGFMGGSMVEQINLKNNNVNETATGAKR